MRTSQITQALQEKKNPVGSAAQTAHDLPTLKLLLEDTLINKISDLVPVTAFHFPNPGNRKLTQERLGNLVCHCAERNK